MDLIETLLDLGDPIFDMFKNVIKIDKDKIKWLKPTLKIILAIFILFTSIPKINEFGFIYTTETNGILKILKAVVNMLVAIFTIFILLKNDGKDDCPKCK